MCPHAVIRISYYCRLKEPALPLIVRVRIASQDNLPSHVYTVFTYLLQLFYVIQYCHWANIGGIEHGISYLHLFKSLLGELVDEFAINLFVHEYSLYRVPRLPSVIVGPFDHCLQSELHVAVGCHVGAVVAAQVELDVDEVIVGDVQVHVVGGLERAHEDDVVDVVLLVLDLHVVGVREEAQGQVCPVKGFLEVRADYKGVSNCRGYLVGSWDYP